MMNEKIPISDLSVSQLAAVGTSNSSLGSGESAECGRSQSGDAREAGVSLSLQVLDRESTT